MSIAALYVFYSITILVVGLLIKKSALRVTLIGFGGFSSFSYIIVWIFGESCIYSDFSFSNCSPSTLEYFSGFASILALVAPPALVFATVAIPLTWFISLFRN